MPRRCPDDCRLLHGPYPTLCASADMMNPGVGDAAWRSHEAGGAMKTTTPSLLVLLASLVAAGGARGEEKEQLPAVARDVLARVKQFELYSLQPDDEKPGEAGRLHGWKVLGKTTVKDAKTRDGL